jgi:chorismate dehydratase
MLKVSIVSYLNTAPFILGIEKCGLMNDSNFLISKDYPSECARKLIDGEVDLGLVPVAILPYLENYQIHGSTCISASGKVDSVVLLSDVPINEIEEIVLDYQSRTSVQLCRILAKELWKISPKFIPANENTMNEIGEKRAIVLIGDRVFDQLGRFNYVTDLSEEWTKLTGLPFVFAVWASAKPIDTKLQEEFEAALQFGLNNLEEAIENASKIYPEYYPVENYLRNRISYKLDSQKRKGLETFLAYLGKL